MYFEVYRSMVERAGYCPKIELFSLDLVSVRERQNVLLIDIQYLLMHDLVLNIQLLPVISGNSIG